MADDPLATALTNNPSLSRTAVAVHAATLVDSLDVTEDLTVLAPTNEAFAAVPPGTFEPLLADTPRLTSLVTHHVVAGRLTPAELAGTHTPSTVTWSPSRARGRASRSAPTRPSWAPLTRRSPAATSGRATRPCTSSTRCSPRRPADGGSPPGRRTASCAKEGATLGDATVEPGPSVGSAA
nr:fasciclin domain-containing protein [Geodermatophilus sp. DF01_2]